MIALVTKECAMEDHKQITVADLKRRAVDGQVLIYEPAEAASGDEPDFYRVIDSGGAGPLPLWENRPPNGREPTPKHSVWDYVPLASADTFRFSIKNSLLKMADLYKLAGSVFLVSRRLLDVIEAIDPDSVEFAPAIVAASDRVSKDGFVTVVPRRALDAVDPRKTKVTVDRRASPPNSSRYVTLVRYENGYVLNAIPSGVENFVEEHVGHWLWSKKLVQAAVGGGAQWLRAVPTSSASGRRPILTTLRSE